MTKETKNSTCVRACCLWLYATLWTVACQAPLSMKFSRQEYWSGLPCLPAWHLPDPGPDPGIEPTSLMSPALAGRFFTTSTNWEAPQILYYINSLLFKAETWMKWSELFIYTECFRKTEQQVWRQWNRTLEQEEWQCDCSQL